MCACNALVWGGGLVFKDRRLLYHSTLGLRVIKKKKEEVKINGKFTPFCNLSQLARVP